MALAADNFDSTDGLILPDLATNLTKAVDATSAMLGNIITTVQEGVSEGGRLSAATLERRTACRPWSRLGGDL